MLNYLIKLQLPSKHKFKIQKKSLALLEHKIKEMSSVFRTQSLVQEPYFVIAKNQGHDFVMQWKLAKLYILEHFFKERQVLYFHTRST